MSCKHQQGLHGQMKRSEMLAKCIDTYFILLMGTSAASVQNVLT